MAIISATLPMKLPMLTSERSAPADLLAPIESTQLSKMLIMPLKTYINAAITIAQNAHRLTVERVDVDVVVVVFLVFFVLAIIILLKLRLRGYYIRKSA